MSTTLQGRMRVTQRISLKKAPCREVRTRAMQNGEQSVRKKHERQPSCIELKGANGKKVANEPKKCFKKMTNTFDNICEHVMISSMVAQYLASYH
jgi:hypothetical protein